MRISRLVLVLAIVLACAAAAYRWYPWHTAPTATNAASQPVEVSVIPVKRQDVPLPLIYSGRVAGFRSVEIRSQVNGTILKREFVEGARVKRDDVLFRIDPRTYQASLDRANAQLSQAQATLVQAEENFNRIQELSQKQVATAKQFEDARAARDLAAAAAEVAKADIQTAKLNLEFTTIRAPVAGSTSLTSPPEGSLAEAQQTVLTTITQLDPAYVNFSVSESEFVELRGMNRARDRPLTPADITVKLQLADRTEFPVAGRLDVSSSTVDPRSGTLQIRSIFPNEDGTLLPNQFVRVVVTGVTLQNVFIIPQRAVSQGPQGAFVYVVNSSNDGVAQRLIKFDREIGDDWAVKDGLKDGEKIVVDGLLRLKPGARIKPNMIAENIQARDVSRDRAQNAVSETSGRAN
jgi:membrane fusion protein, multidrug efflux system